MKMNACEEFIEKLDKQLPEICTIHDLIRAGIVTHRNTMEHYRKKNIGPPFLKLSQRKIYYPKEGILRWLKGKSNAGCEESSQSFG